MKTHLDFELKELEIPNENLSKDHLIEIMKLFSDSIAKFSEEQLSSRNKKVKNKVYRILAGMQRKIAQILRRLKVEELSNEDLRSFLNALDSEINSKINSLRIYEAPNIIHAIKKNRSKLRGYLEEYQNINNALPLKGSVEKSVIVETKEIEGVLTEENVHFILNQSLKKVGSVLSGNLQGQGVKNAFISKDLLEVIFDYFSFLGDELLNLFDQYSSLQTSDFLDRLSVVTEEFKQLTHDDVVLSNFENKIKNHFIKLLSKSLTQIFEGVGLALKDESELMDYHEFEEILVGFKIEEILEEKKVSIEGIEKDFIVKNMNSGHLSEMTLMVNHHFHGGLDYRTLSEIQKTISSVKSAAENISFQDISSELEGLILPEATELNEEISLIDLRLGIEKAKTSSINWVEEAVGFDYQVKGGGMSFKNLLITNLKILFDKSLGSINNRLAKKGLNSQEVIDNWLYFNLNFHFNQFKEVVNKSCPDEIDKEFVFSQINISINEFKMSLKEKYSWLNFNNSLVVNDGVLLTPQARYQNQLTRMIPLYNSWLKGVLTTSKDMDYFFENVGHTNNLDIDALVDDHQYCANQLEDLKAKLEALIEALDEGKKSLY